jgi:hypothetical protein
MLQGGRWIDLQQRSGRYQLSRDGLSCVLRQAAQLPNDRAIQLIGTDTRRKLRDDDAGKGGTIGAPATRSRRPLVGPSSLTSRTGNIRPLCSTPAPAATPAVSASGASFAVPWGRGFAAAGTALAAGVWLTTGFGAVAPAIPPGALIAAPALPAATPLRPFVGLLLVGHIGCSCRNQ